MNVLLIVLGVVLYFALGYITCTILLFMEYYIEKHKEHNELYTVETYLNSGNFETTIPILVLMFLFNPIVLVILIIHFIIYIIKKPTIDILEWMERKFD